MIIALAVDADVHWNVVVPELKENEMFQLLPLKIESNEFGVLALASEKPKDLDGKANQVQSLDLKKGVYLIVTPKGLQYERVGQVRVYIQGGKDPWPPPVPPAPQGTDLAEHKELYETQFSSVLIAAPVGGPRWIEVKEHWKPVVAPVEGRHG